MSLHVLHTCDTKRCVNPEHLYLGKDAENQRDVAIRGTRETKLTNTRVLSIRKDGGLHREIAKKHSISRSLVGLIKRGKRRQHV